MLSLLGIFIACCHPPYVSLASQVAEDGSLYAVELEMASTPHPLGTHEL